MAGASLPPRVPKTEAAQCVWAAGATLGEGTCWSAGEQTLYWVDILGQQLHRYTPASGEQRSWAFEETISAVAVRFDAPGLAVTLRHGFAYFDPATNTLERLIEPEPERANNRFNDGKCDAQGRFWAGTMDFDATAPTGALYCLDAGGACVRALDVGWPVTNGPTWSLDGRTMLFNDTARGRVWAYDVDPETGMPSRQRLWLRFASEDGFPDGMTTDAAGRIWIAHWGGACVTCHAFPSATELAHVRLPTSHITNVAFGGPSMKTLYVTSARAGLSEQQLADEPLAGGLFAIETDAEGFAAHLFAG